MNKILAIITALLAVTLMSMQNPLVDIVNQVNEKRESRILFATMGIVDYLHFQPKDVTDELSEEIFLDYLKEIDQSKRFLTKQDIALLQKHKFEIDDQIEAFNFSFFNQAEDLIEVGIQRSHDIYQSVIAGDLAIDELEVLELDAEKRDYAADAVELADVWRKYMKFSVVAKISEIQEQGILTDSLSELEIREKAQKDVKKTFDEWFSRMDELRREDRFDQYMNTITHQFDPHSEYFSPKGKENFDIQMGNKLEGIGARLQKAGDFVKIFSIVPGGPAWKGKDLKVDDVILSVRQKDERDAVDITGMRLDDVISMIRGPKGTTVILNVKRLDGTLHAVMIERDEVILDDAAAKSMIISAEGYNDKIGYIQLPIFYSTFDGGNSCSNDIEEELEKLKREEVNGVILDLRYNGGGSLPDVIEMAGLFIEKGPVVQVKSRDGKPEVQYDPDPTVTYDGPLIVMVNEVSASASEILAAALQDYGRAIIVGGDKTFGKATVQGVYNLDRMIRGESDVKPLGQIKLTTQKFFRINGSSNQLKGVVPDIHLPDQFDFMEYGEDLYEDALSYSEINAVNFGQDIYKVKAKETLAKKSASRVAKSDFFDKVQEYGELVEQREDDTEISISLKEYLAEVDKEDAELKPFEDMREANVEGILIRNLDEDRSFIDLDESRKAKNLDFIEGLTKDHYLYETMMIMQDMIEQDRRLVQK